MPGPNMQGNAYASRGSAYAGEQGNAPDYGGPTNAYAAPDIHRDAPWNDEFGWADKTRIGLETTPDAMREMQYPVRTFYPGDREAPGVFYGMRDAEEKSRHSVEDQDANGWEERKNRYKIGPDPRWDPPAETRWTARMAPRSYSFVRPFDQRSKGNGARQFNGMHFSMADHRREYDVMGMRPWAPRRNTYRVDPTPWDADQYDIPDPSTVGTSVYERIQTYELPASQNRSYRL